MGRWQGQPGRWQHCRVGQWRPLGCECASPHLNGLGRDHGAQLLVLSSEDRPSPSSLASAPPVPVPLCSLWALLFSALWRAWVQFLSSSGICYPADIPNLAGVLKEVVSMGLSEWTVLIPGLFPSLPSVCPTQHPLLATWTGFPSTLQQGSR